MTAELARRARAGRCIEEIPQQVGFSGVFPGLYELSSWSVFDKMAVFRRY